MALTPLSLPLNRWVRIVVTAGSTGASILLDGVQVASTGTASAPPTASTSVTLGYAEGVSARFIGSMDEVLVLNAVPASANTLPNLAVRGILLNPNGTDTDSDGLADGQELFVKSVKTPKRYPTKDQLWVASDKVDLALGAPGWAIQGVTAMVGFTHGNMGQIAAWLERWTGAVDDLGVFLRQYGNAGQANNFTSYDLLQKPPLGGSQLVRDDLVVPGRTWYVKAYDSTVNTNGAIEYLQLQVTVRTWPNRADTDSDGLNDSEEMNLGSDGYATDPWKTDTDGDLWSDGYETLTKGTNPLAWDTDGDGVRDSSDLDPLRNLLVAVKVKKIFHGANSLCTPKLAGIVWVNNAYTWVTEHRMASEDVYWTFCGEIRATGVFDLAYYADVPDDVSSVTVRAAGWSIVDGRWDDLLVDASVSYDLNSGASACVVNSGVSLCTITNGNSWMTFDVWTVALPKTKTLFVTDGNATITLANGQSRLVGQDRYYVFAFDVTSAYGPFVVGVNTIVVPRSIFLDSKLRKDFDGGTFAPLSDATLYGEDLGAANISDSVAGTVSKSLSGVDAYDVLSRLLRNSTNVPVYQYLDLTSYVVLANLPYDVVKILPWVRVTSGLTGAPPDGMPGFVNVLVQLGQMFYKGLVALATFLVDLAQAIVDWGMKALGAVSSTIVAVAQKAAQALGQFVDAIVASIMNTVRAMIDPVTSAIRSAIAQWVEGLRALIYTNFVAHSPIQTLGDYLAIFTSIWSYILIPLVLITALVVVAQAIDVIVQVASLGIASVLERVAGAAVPLFLFGVAAAAVGAVSLSFANGINQLFIDQLGAAGGYISGITDTAAGMFFLIQSALTRSLFTSAAAFSLLSILIAIIATTDVWWVNLMLVSISEIFSADQIRSYKTIRSVADRNRIMGVLVLMKDGRKIRYSDKRTPEVSKCILELVSRAGTREDLVGRQLVG